MKDIAEALGVSIVTVSKALRNHPDIAEDTQRRILEKAESLHYRPNLMARSLVTGRSSLVGLVVPDLVHPFFAEIAKSLSGALRTRGLFLIVCSSEGDPAFEQIEIDQMLALRPDALIIASCQAAADSLSLVMSSGPPLILIDRTVPGLKTHFVGSDDHRIGELATNHLIGMGRKRIAHIRGPANSVGDLRLSGYRDALAKHGLKQNKQHIILPANQVDTDGQTHAARAMVQLLAARPRPDAIFCFNDLIAVGALSAALDAGVRVPEEMAFIGCGNYHYGRTLQVPLSSIDQKIEDFGQTLAKLTFSLIDAKRPSRPRRIVLKPELVVRRSSGN